jgi:hypothetical protein
MLCSGLPGPGRITGSLRRNSSNTDGASCIASDPKRAFLVQQQISELGPADAHSVQFTWQRTDDFENLSGREQLL